MITGIAIGLVAGAALGFGFRGWISRQKIAIGEHILSAVKNGEQWALSIVTKVESKL